MIYIAIMFYINTCVPFNDEMICSWHREIHLDTIGEGKAILILEIIFKTLIKLMIKEIHKAGIGAGCD